MLIVGFGNLGQNQLQDKYKEKFKIIDVEDYNNFGKEKYIKYLEDIKKNLNIYGIVYVDYSLETVSCLNALNIEYKFILDKSDTISLSTANKIGNDKILIDKDDTIEILLGLEEPKTEKVEEHKVENKQEGVEEKSSLVVPVNKNKITLQELLNEDMEITEADVRDLKATQNKLKVGMLLQAKSMLTRVSKLSDTLNKLYDELIDRIDGSIKTTDTASLMYTADYLSKALHDTNQFIISLINNEKIQNFFVIDNSTVINTSETGIDMEKREKIRKAVEIVINNFDYFANGDFSKVKNPNVVEAEIVEEESDVNSTT